MISIVQHQNLKLRFRKIVTQYGKTDGKFEISGPKLAISIAFIFVSEE